VTRGFKSCRGTIGQATYTGAIFWTLIGTTVAFDSIPAVCVENVKYRKK